MKSACVFALLFFALQAEGQDTIPNGSLADSVNKSADIPATFPGGNKAWNNYLASKLRPTTAADNGAPRGIYTVTVIYVIDTTGQITDLQVIQDPGYNTAADVLHAFKKAPRWIAAIQNGRKVKYRQKQNFYYEVSEH